MLTVILGLVFVLSACSEDTGTPDRKICAANETRDCVCSDTSSGKQECLEDGTRYGICLCGSASVDGGDAPMDAASGSLDAAPPPRFDGGDTVDAASPPMNRDGGMMGGPVDDAGRRIPPQISYDACMGLNEGDVCSFTHPRRGEVMGTCRYRDGDPELFCRVPRN
jgi:hypothetical protein